MDTSVPITTVHYPEGQTLFLCACTGGDASSFVLHSMFARVPRAATIMFVLNVLVCFCELSVIKPSSTAHRKWHSKLSASPVLPSRSPLSNTTSKEPDQEIRLEESRNNEIKMCHLERMVHTCGHNMSCWNWCCEDRPGIKCRKGVGNQMGFTTTRGEAALLPWLCPECGERAAEIEEAKTKGKGKE